MSTITTRAGKGSPLTSTEVDSNFTNLNTDKVEKSGDTMTGALNFGDSTNINLGAGNDLNLQHNSGFGNIIDTNDKTLNMICDTGGTVSVNNGVFSSGFKSAAVFDPDGGQFIRYDGSTKLATTSSGVDITGTVNVNGAYTLPTSDGTNGQVLTTDGSGAVTFQDASGGGGGGITTGKAIAMAIVFG